MAKNKGLHAPWARDHTAPLYYGYWTDFLDPRDFLRYTQTMGTGSSPALWTVTVTGTTPTAVVTAAKGGTFVLTMSGSQDDKFIAVEAQLNVNPAKGDSLVFHVGFTTGTNIATTNAVYGIADVVTNACTRTTGYIASGVVLSVVAGVLKLWTGNVATATADMTQTTLETLVASTTYRYTVEVYFDPTTQGAGTVTVWKTDANGNATRVTTLQTAGGVGGLPQGVAMGQIWGVLATSTTSPVFTYDYWGYQASR